MQKAAVAVGWKVRVALAVGSDGVTEGAVLSFVMEIRCQESGEHGLGFGAGGFNGEEVLVDFAE